MPLDNSAIKAIVFDYGNTLVPFRPEELAQYGAILSQALKDHFGPFDEDQFFRFREASRMEPYQGDPPSYRENDMRDITTRLVRELYNHEITLEELDDLQQVRHDAFLKVIRVEAHVSDVLTSLNEHWALGILSNYPDGPAVKTSLKNIGLAHFFSSVVVSGDWEYIKPHPLVFAASLKELGVTAQEVLFVGDNWLADIQGAKRLGMQAVYITQWTTLDHFEPQSGDHPADATINHITELPALLGISA